MNKYLKRTIIAVCIIIGVYFLGWLLYPRKIVFRDGGSVGYTSPVYEIVYTYRTMVSEHEIVNLDEFEDQNDVRSNCVYKDIKITWFPD